MLMKTFFFMRLFKKLAHLVMMVFQVLLDLRAFMCFYLILLWISGLVFNVLGLNNTSIEINQLKKTGIAYPGQEYQYLPKFLRQFFYSIRISLGDFEFGETTSLGSTELNLFWFTWMLTVLLTCIVFLNFIIAEISSSYEQAKKRVKGLIDKQRAFLIREAEDILLHGGKTNQDLIPRYLIRREIED